MPPNDDVFGNQPDEGQPPANPPAQQGGQPPAQQAQPAADPQLGDRLDRIEQSLEGVGQVFQALQQRLNQAPSQPQPQSDPANQDDWADRFYNDPRSTISQEFADQARQVVAPTAESIAALTIERERQQIDKRWGEGAWDKFYQPTLGPVIDAIRDGPNPAQLLNRTALSNAIASTTGRNVDDLQAHRSGWQKAQEDRETEAVGKIVEATLSRTNLVGGIAHRPRNGQDQLTPDQKEILATFQKETGEEQNEQELAKLMAISNPSGTTLSDFQKATASESKEGDS